MRYKNKNYLTTLIQHIMFTTHTYIHTYIQSWQTHTQTDRQTMLFDVNLEERGGIVPTLIPPGLGLWLFPSFPLFLNITISDISSQNQWTVLLVLLDLVTRMSQQWSHNMNYDYKKWTMIMHIMSWIMYIVQQLLIKSSNCVIERSQNV